MSNVVPFLPSDFNYILPKELIAQEPVEPRDHSRLLVIDKQSGRLTDAHFFDLPDYLTDNDVLVLNETKVFPARVFGKKITGGKVELLLLEQLNAQIWRALSKPGLRLGQSVLFSDGSTAEVLEIDSEGVLTIALKHSAPTVYAWLQQSGATPLPPYIKSHSSEQELRKRYQTIYARFDGSAAAPTAGLHFTDELFAKLIHKGVQIEKITLHVGLGTFMPLRDEQLVTGQLHHEKFSLDADTASRLVEAKKRGKRIVSVGTTTTRALESAVSFINNEVRLLSGAQETQLFLYPGCAFRFVDDLITNFHLPETSLLMLVTALLAKPNGVHTFSKFLDSPIGKAYQHAVEQKYRFFSFGDAMLLR